VTDAGALVVNLFDDQPLHVPAWKFYCDKARFKLARAGRRGAKSYTGAKAFWANVWERDWPIWSQRPYFPGARPGTSMWRKRRPRMHYWVVADTFELLDEPRRYLFQFLPPELIDDFNASNNQLWLKGDILVEFKTIHDPSKKVGSGLNGMWIEEAARVRSDAWGLYLRPALADKQGWCILTTTPLGKDWTFEAIEEMARKGHPEYACHEWKSLDNIRCPGLVEEVELARQTLPPEYFEREWEASRQAFIGQIYKSFKANKHVFKTIPDGTQMHRRLGGADWGNANPGCLLAGAITAHDRPHVYITDEVYSASMLVEDFWVPEAKKLMMTRRFNDWVADPAEPDNLLRFRNAGIQVAKHRNFAAGGWDEHARSVMAGIRTFGALIFQDRFHVHESCTNLISELENYVWDRTSAGLQLDRPKPHQKDHAVTTARYIVSAGLEGPMLRAVA
jgi:hypothetical protein